MTTAKRFEVIEYAADGKRVGACAGLGRFNRGKWDCDHSERSAYRHAAALRLQFPRSTFKIEEV